MKKALPIIFLVVLAIITITIRQCGHTTDLNLSTTGKNYPTQGLNRNPARINYSRHARCRMECRHIDESEVKELLTDGKINYAKSELKTDDCHKKYAVEGYSHDSQKLRIIFAPCNDEVTVVTVIDLGKEWVCDCD